jgi:hypothetical protein
LTRYPSLLNSFVAEHARLVRNFINQQAHALACLLLIWGILYLPLAEVEILGNGECPQDEVVVKAELKSQHAIQLQVCLLPLTSLTAQRGNKVHLFLCEGMTHSFSAVTVLA